MKATRERWRTSCQRIRARDNPLTGRTIDSTYDEIVDLYTASSRHYHDLSHIGNGLAEIDKIWHLAADPDSLEIAWWFHDIIYDVTNRPGENEFQSALYARKILLELGLTTGIWLEIMRLIIATTHDHIPRNIDAKLIVDIDLVSLASPLNIFDKHTAEIREEYRKVAPDDKDFNAGRIRFFQMFLGARPSIYLTEHFLKKYENSARKNIKNYLARFENK